MIAHSAIVSLLLSFLPSEVNVDRRYGWMVLVIILGGDHGVIEGVVRSVSSTEKITGLAWATSTKITDTPATHSWIPGWSIELFRSSVTSSAGETVAGRLARAWCWFWAALPRLHSDAQLHHGKYLLHAQLGNTCLCSACRNGLGRRQRGGDKGADTAEVCCEGSGAG